MSSWFFPPRLMGVNLNRWHYLGMTKLTITIQNTNDVYDEAWVYLFCKKNDFSQRKFIVEKNVSTHFKTHKWITNYIPLWVAGEYPLYHAIADEPSVWLREYMLDEHNCLWDNDTNNWYDNNRPTIETEGNVVKLSFPNTKKGVDAEMKVE